MPPAPDARRPPGFDPPQLRDALRPKRFIDFQRAGVALFVAGLLALGVGIATGSPANGKSSPEKATAPSLQAVAPNSGPEIPPAPANVASPPPPAAPGAP